MPKEKSTKIISKMATKKSLKNPKQNPQRQPEKWRINPSKNKNKNQTLENGGQETKRMKPLKQFEQINWRLTAHLKSGQPMNECLCNQHSPKIAALLT